MATLEDHVRFDLSEDRDQYRPAGDHQITHAGSSVSQIPGPEDRADPLEPLSGLSALGEREARSDVVPEAILLLPDELEVDASISVQESRQVGRVRSPHRVAFPRYCPDRTVRV